MAISASLGATEADTVFEYLDHETAVSVTGALKPLVFARERRDLAANARDYVTLTAIEINRTGKRTYFWSGYLWSTADRRSAEPLLAADDALVLIANGRPIRLDSAPGTLRDQGIAQAPTPAPLRTAVPVLYRADPEIFEYLASATDVHLELVRAGISEPFDLWMDGRAALRALVDRLGPGS
jgi:hypothetical protein